MLCVKANSTYTLQTTGPDTFFKRKYVETIKRTRPIKENSAPASGRKVNAPPRPRKVKMVVSSKDPQEAQPIPSAPIIKPEVLVFTPRVFLNFLMWYMKRETFKAKKKQMRTMKVAAKGVKLVWMDESKLKESLKASPAPKALKTSTINGRLVKRTARLNVIKKTNSDISR